MRLAQRAETQGILEAQGRRKGCWHLIGARGKTIVDETFVGSVTQNHKLDWEAPVGYHHASNIGTFVRLVWVRNLETEIIG